MSGPMDTLRDRMGKFHAAGWVVQLSVSDGGVRCGSCQQWAAAEDVVVDEVDRFEGMSDPADESILFAISMPCGHRGTLPAAYGKDTAPAVADVVTRLPPTAGAGATGATGATGDLGGRRADLSPKTLPD